MTEDLEIDDHNNGADMDKEEPSLECISTDEGVGFSPEEVFISDIVEVDPAYLSLFRKVSEMYKKHPTIEVQLVLTHKATVQFRAIVKMLHDGNLNSPSLEKYLGCKILIKG